MKPWVNFFRAIIFLIGIIVIAFAVLVYIFCEKQKTEMDTLSKQLQIDTQVNENKFKYQEGKIERLSKDLEESIQQIKDQKVALLQEADKRQQIESDSKSIQSSLVDIKAETDAIKQDVKGWQKDYVSVLAQLEKKIDYSQGEIKSVEDNLISLNIPELKENIKSLKADVEKITPPSPSNDIIVTTPAPEKKSEQP